MQKLTPEEIESRNKIKLETRARKEFERAEKRQRKIEEDDKIRQQKELERAEKRQRKIEEDAEIRQQKELERAEKRQRKIEEDDKIRQQKRDERAKERQQIEMEKENTKKQYNQTIQDFLKRNPIYYDINKLYWSWDWSQRCYNIADDTEIMNRLTQLTGIVIIKAKEKFEFLESVRQFGRLSKPKKLPLNYIQFKDFVIDINTGDKFIANPDFMYTNSIPWNFGSTDSTPTIDKLFKSWVGRTHIKTLYEIMAYCLYNDYPIHEYFVLFGSGRNGKGQFTTILEKFINKSNTCTTDLDKLGSSRFESAKLYKKQICFVNETDSGIMKKSSTLKALTGNDPQGMEMKGKNPFDAHNYAKIIISTNNLPQSNDKSDGFFSRFIKVGFPNQFTADKKVTNIIDTIPNEEYENLGVKLIPILKDLLDRGEFIENKSINEKSNEYEMLSEPAKYYLNLNYEYSDNNTDIILTTEFVSKFNIWRDNNNIAKINNKKLYGAINEKYEHKRLIIGGRKNSYILNIKKKDNNINPNINPFIEPIPEEYL